MNSRILMIMLLMPFGAFAAEEQVLSQPAENQQQAANPYLDFNKRVQERLTALGFYTGPINGDIGPNTQAALAQFQLSVPMPVSGSLDDQTVAALGVERSVQASAGASADASPPQPQQEANANAEASGGAGRPAEVKGN